MDTDAIQLLVLDLVLKSTVILGLALVILRVRKQVSAAQRNYVWTLVFAVLLMLPLMRLVEPHWTLAWHKDVPMEMKQVEPIVAMTETAPVQEVAVVVTPPRSLSMPDPVMILVYGWIAGIALLLSYRLVGSVLLVRSRWTSLPLGDGAVEAMASSSAAACGISRSVKVRLSTDHPVPVTWGTWRPVIMLPKEAMNWPREWLEAALWHEMGHIRNFDHLKRWGTFLACVFYWPHPLVWMAARRFQIAQEEASDNVVLGGEISPQTYATQLLEVIRRAAGQRTSPLPVLAMARRSTVEGRIAAILDETRNRRSSGRRFVMVGVGLAMLLGVVLGMVQLRAEVTNTVVKKSAVVSVTSSDPDVKLEFRLFLIADKTYSAQKTAIDEAVEKRDLIFLMHLPGTSVLNLPAVTTHDGEKANIDLIEELRYAISFEKDKDGKMVPTDFKTRHLGLSILTTPKLTADGLSLDLSFFGELTSFGGWIPVSPGVRQPVFLTNRFNTKYLMGPNGAAFWLGTKPMVNVPPDGINPGTVFSLQESNKPMRPLIFVSWKLVPPEPILVAAEQQGLMARVSFKIFQISQKTYVEQSAAIDAALHEGDAKFMEALPQFKLLDDSSLVAKMGEQAVCDVMHPIPYPARFNTGGNKMRDCGIKIVYTTSLATDGTISLNLMPEITSYQGTFKNTAGQDEPIFNIRRLSSRVAVSRGQPYGLWARDEGVDMSKIMSWGPNGAHEDIYHLDPTPVRIGMIVTAELYTSDGKKLP